MTETTATQTIEIDRSDDAPRIKLAMAAAEFSPRELRQYADYLRLVADEAEARPEPDVDALVAVFDATEARWLSWPDAARVLARAVLQAGYGRLSP
jgi:hypothetical protein